MRVSQKTIKLYCECLGLELIQHQWLGNRKDYYYEYSIVNKTTKQVIIKSTTLKKIYEILKEMI